MTLQPDWFLTMTPERIAALETPYEQLTREQRQLRRKLRNDAYSMRRQDLRAIDAAKASAIAKYEARQAQREITGAERAAQADRGHGNNHPTVKPTDLMRYLCRLVTQPDGVVLDPFMGSGSTGKGAILEGFRFVGIEREAEYIDIARARIQHAVDSLPNTLFDNTGE